MELIDYTNKWVSGEIMEDFAMVVGGMVCLVLALVAWRWGTSEAARAIILPLINFFSKERGVIYQQELNIFKTEIVG